tara:strand:+ start:259527 stop:260273 length:747 start_codon:yes stop_codon:yes gene_type:complete
MKILPQLGYRVSLLPTTLLGRHPGWGLPGGGGVPFDHFTGVAGGLVANDLPARSDLVVTGYFTSAEQVKFAADLISEHVSGRGLVVVDPIMGDDGKGLYVPEEVAAAIVSELLPLADVITPNAWEFLETERRLGHKIEQSDILPQRTELRAQLVHNAEPYARYITSVHDSGHVGILSARGQDIAFAAAPFIKDGVPNGTGDLTTLLIADAELKGDVSDEKLKTLVGQINANILTSQDGELTGVLADAP